MSETADVDGIDFTALSDKCNYISEENNNSIKQSQVYDDLNSVVTEKNELPTEKDDLSSSGHQFASPEPGSLLTAVQDVSQSVSEALNSVFSSLPPSPPSRSDSFRANKVSKTVSTTVTPLPPTPPPCELMQSQDLRPPPLPSPPLCNSSPLPP